MTDNSGFDCSTATPLKTALENLLGFSVQEKAGPVVVAALVQSLIDNLSNEGAQKAAKPLNFKTSLFPGRNPTALSKLVPTDTQMSATTLAAYSNAVVCQAMFYWTTANFRLDTSKINHDVAAYGAIMFPGIRYLGLYAIAQDAQVVKLAKLALAAGATLQDYTSYIISCVIPSRILLYRDKHWLNGDREIYDWLGKYLALGGKVPGLEAFLSQMYAGGLPVFPNLTWATLTKYRGYLDRSSGPSYTDIGFAKGTLTYSPQACGYGQCITNTDINTFTYLNFSTLADKYSTLSSCCAEDTEIFLANGQRKLITQLNSMDVVQGLNGPVKPLYVSRTPLKSRELYEFFSPGSGPRLTGGHPIVNPTWTESVSKEVPAALAVSPHSLRQGLPNHHRSGVGGICQGDTAVHVCNPSYANEAQVRVEKISAVRVTDSSEHGSDVFDIVLPFSLKERLGYWAGRGDKFMLIEPEIAKVKDDPFVAAAIYEFVIGMAMTGLGGAGRRGPAAMRQFCTMYANQFYELAFRVALVEATADQKPPYGLDEMSAMIDTFISDSWDNNPDLVADLAVFLETCTQYLYVPLSNVIRNAWRRVPKEDLRRSMTPEGTHENRGDALAITFFDLELVDRPETFGDRTLQLRAHLGCDEDTLTDTPCVLRQCSDSPDHIFRRVYDHTIDLRMPNAEARPLLKLEIVDPASGEPIAASMARPLPTQTYGLGRALFHDCQGELVAYLNFDTRRHTHAAGKLDSSRGEWNEEHQFAYAVAFGRCMVKPVADALERGSVV